MSKIAPTTLTQAFTVPAGSGSYATEILYLNTANGASAPDNTWADLVNIIVHTLVTGAVVELQTLDQDGSTWTIASTLDTATDSMFSAVLLQHHARIRVKSGGTAGTQTITVRIA